MKQFNMINIGRIIQEEFDNFNRWEYLSWKRKNVTLRGIKELGNDNEVFGSFGKGLYTTPLSNRSMAKEYGKVYYVVNGKPKKPKVVNNLNEAEIWIQKLVNNFCKENNKEYDLRYFEDNTSIEKEMLDLGYDGLVIKGREMVNYKPKDILYFENEDQLKMYYEDNF